MFTCLYPRPPPHCLKRGYIKVMIPLLVKLELPSCRSGRQAARRTPLGNPRKASLQLPGAYVRVTANQYGRSHRRSHSQAFPSK